MLTSGQGKPAPGHWWRRSPPVVRVRSATSAGQGSPIISSASGVETTPWVIPCPASQRIIRGAETRQSSSGMWRLAPAARQDQTSQTETSNEGPENRVARSSGVSRKVSRCQRISRLSEACSISAPLGRPVEPEV